MSVLLRKITGFSGLVHENMYQSMGWRFLSIGRSLERAGFMAGLLGRFADLSAPEGGLDLAVEVGDSAMSHRRRYAVVTSRGTVVDLLGLDGMNPRALLFQITEIRDHVALLPHAMRHGQMSALSRMVLQLHTSIAIRTPDTFETEDLEAVRGEIAALSDALSSAFLS